MENQSFDKRRIKDLPPHFSNVSPSKFYSAGTFLDEEDDLLLLENDHESNPKIKMIGGTAEDVRILKQDTYFELLEEILRRATNADGSRKWWSDDLVERLLDYEEQSIYRVGYRPEECQLVLSFLAKTGYYPLNFSFVWRQVELPRGLEQYYFVVKDMLEPAKDDETEFAEVKIISSDSGFKPLDPNVKRARISQELGGAVESISLSTHQNAFKKGILRELCGIRGQEFSRKFAHLMI